jgi:RNA polymerase-binding transcription factor DksA
MPQFDDMHARLTEMQLQLTEKLERIVNNLTTGANSDWSEQAQERENDEVMDALGNEVRRELRLVNIALHRLDAGDYQYCVDCGEDIAIERLNVLPFVQHCIKCASKRD